ncbi:uncharacterized protein KY384_001301 [Bacidia gigantensis]|uniref:uncharacterized protein n=1 Tax=Bacidia gigantensis TaxID=2732470 RepID=UPI001D05C0B2|nr:uncharacterized protein KY384_001301 [Bacidia gigantensis]KAG8533561.1 hypothetical protein KY384_001301 [Bacidia gigantensis]
MSSLPPSKSCTARDKQPDEKFEALRKAALKHIADAKAKSRKKAAAAATTTPAPIADFVLFPENAATKRQRSNSSKLSAGSSADAERREERQQKPADACLPQTPPDSPRRRQRVPRHGGFRIVPLVDDDTDKVDAIERRWAERPPPAPAPPRLDSPDVSDADEDVFWHCCGSEASGEQRKSAV